MLMCQPFTLRILVEKRDKQDTASAVDLSEGPRSQCRGLCHSCRPLRADLSVHPTVHAHVVAQEPSALSICWLQPSGTKGLRTEF